GAGAILKVTPAAGDPAPRPPDMAEQRCGPLEEHASVERNLLRAQNVARGLGVQERLDDLDRHALPLNLSLKFCRRQAFDVRLDEPRWSHKRRLQGPHHATAVTARKDQGSPPVSSN